MTQSAEEPPAAGAQEDAPPPSLKKIVVRGVRYAGGGYVLGQAITLATYLALAKILKPSDFGVFAAGSLVVGIGSIAGESGMLAALIHRRGNVEAALNTALIANLVGGVLLTLLALALSPAIGALFHSDHVAVVAAVMSGCMLLRLAVIVPDALMQRRFSFLRRVVVDPVGMCIFAVAAIWTSLAGWGVWSLVFATYCQLAANVASAWMLVRWRPRPRLASIAIWRELTRYGRPAVAAELVRRATLETPVLALGRFVGSAALGQFTYSLRVATQPFGSVVNVGSYVLLPAFSRISHEDTRFRDAFIRSLRWMCIVAFPLALLLLPLGVPAVVLVFGHRWHEAGQGAAVLGIYCAALTLDSVASEAWKACGRPDMLPRMHTLSLVLTVGFVLALTPFGLIGVTLGMSVSAVCVAMYATRGVARVVGLPLRDLVGEIARPLAAGLPMVLALFALDRFVVHAEQRRPVLGLTLLAAEALLGLTIYTVALYGLSSPFAKELRRLVSMRSPGPPTIRNHPEAGGTP